MTQIRHLICGAAILALLSNVQAATSATLDANVSLQNPGFEGTYRALGNTGKVTGQIAEGWDDNSSWADVAVNYAPDPTNAHGGATAQRITIGAVRDGAIQFVQTAPLKKGHTYVFKVWLRGNVGSMVALALRKKGEPYTQYAGSTAALSAEWQEFHVAGLVPEDTDVFLMIRATAPMTFWAEDARLEDMTQMQTPPDQTAAAVSLKNPGMEGTYRALGATGKATGQIADGWDDNSSWADVAVAYAPDNVNPHSGETCQRIAVTTVRNGAVHFVQTAFLEKDHVYAFSIWLRGSAGTMLTLAIRKPGAPYTEYAGTTAALSPEWQKFSVFGTMPEDSQVLLMVRPSAPMTLWADDASLEDLTGVKNDMAARAGNLVNGGSFEAGPSFGWSATARGPMRNRFGDPRLRTDAATAAVGRASARYDIPAGDSVQIRSPILALAANRPQAISLWLKASVNDLDVRAELEKTDIGQNVRVGKEWKRYSITGMAPYLPFTRLTVKCQTTDGSGGATLWMDGVQVEEAPAASPSYRAPFPADMTLRLPRPGSVVFEDETTSVEVGIAPEPPEGARLRLSATDIYGAKYDLPSIALPAVSFPLPSFRARLRGTFELRGEVLDRDGHALSAPVELVWSRLPRPREIDPRKSFFGLHICLTPDYIALARAAGIRRVRLHDASMIGKWAIAETEPGKWEFHDEAITAAHDAGLAVLGLLDGAPRWASNNPREGGYWGVWNIPDKPDALAMWENYVRTVASHYQGRIDDWEVWNEPWGRWFTEAGGKPALYGQLVRGAYRILKEVNTNGLLIAIDTYRGRDEWTTNALAATGNQFFDGFSFHDYNDAIYGGPDSPAQIQARVFTDFQKKFGTPKPLWDTEGGAGDLASFYAPETGGLPVQLQPTFIVRHDVTYMGAGIQACFIYAAHPDPAMGETAFQTTECDRALKPVLAARAVLASLVDGVGRPSRSEPEKGLDLYTFPPDKGQTVSVAWSYDGAAHALPVPHGAKALDVFGNPLPQATDPLSIGPEPVYLISPALAGQ